MSLEEYYEFDLPLSVHNTCSTACIYHQDKYPLCVCANGQKDISVRFDVYGVIQSDTIAVTSNECSIDGCDHYMEDPVTGELRGVILFKDHLLEPNGKHLHNISRIGYDCPITEKGRYLIKAYYINEFDCPGALKCFDMIPLPEFTLILN